MVALLPSPEVPAVPAVGTLLLSCVLCEVQLSYTVKWRREGAGFSWPPQPGCEPVSFPVASHWNPLRTVGVLRLGVLKVGTNSSDSENLHGCAGEGLRVFSICGLSLLCLTLRLFSGAPLMLFENGRALSDNEVQKTVSVEKNCQGKHWEAAKI